MIIQSEAGAKASEPRRVPRHKRTITDGATGSAATRCENIRSSESRSTAGESEQQQGSGPEATTANAGSIRNKSAREYRRKARARTYARRPAGQL